MFGVGKVEITKVVFKPEEFIRFNMDPATQVTTIEMINNEQSDICLKWKSTRTPVYKVKPNFAIVKANSTQKFEIHCRSAEKEYSAPRDRFTAEMSVIKSTTVLPKRIWKDTKFQKELFIGKRHKKYIFVVFNGVNKEDWWNKEISGKPFEKRQPTFGLVDESEEKEPAVMSALLAGNFTLQIIPLEQLGGKSADPVTDHEDAGGDGQEQNNQ